MNTFPNLARSPERFDEEQPKIDLIVGEELRQAGIQALCPYKSFRLNGEVPTSLVGFIEGISWQFERRWYYYSAQGPGIPPDLAEQLHGTHGRSVRVDGHCGCPSPKEWFKGFAVGRYHVDNPDGLKALADTIKKILSSVAA